MSMYSYYMFMYVHRANRHSSANLIEVSPCFFICKANVRVKAAKTGHGTHSSKIFVLFYVLFVLCCSVYCLCVLMCTVLLPLGGHPIAVNKFIMYHIQTMLRGSQGIRDRFSEDPWLYFCNHCFKVFLFFNSKKLLWKQKSWYFFN